jgi:hypothetical protein
VTGTLTVRFWLTDTDGTEHAVTRAEWVAKTMSLGVRPETMRWSARNASGRQEYVLPGACDE